MKNFQLIPRRALKIVLALLVNFTSAFLCMAARPTGRPLSRFILFELWRLHCACIKIEQTSQFNAQRHSHETVGVMPGEPMRTTFSDLYSADKLKCTLLADEHGITLNKVVKMVNLRVVVLQFVGRVTPNHFACTHECPKESPNNKKKKKTSSIGKSPEMAKNTQSHRASNTLFHNFCRNQLARHENVFGRNNKPLGTTIRLWMLFIRWRQDTKWWTERWPPSFYVVRFDVRFADPLTVARTKCDDETPNWQG